MDRYNSISVFHSSCLGIFFIISPILIVISLVSTDIDISRIEAESGIHYDDVQIDAIRRAAESKVMVLTGGPGTGKTTTTQGIIAAFKSMGLSVVLAAPTGRAAKRMTEATGLEAKTIHRLLECKPPEGYQRNDENPIEGDALSVQRLMG